MMSPGLYLGPGLYPGPGVHPGPGFYPGIYGISNTGVTNNEYQIDNYYRYD